MTPVPAARHARLRIVFVSDAIRAAVTGTGRMAEVLMRELVAAGHEVLPVDREPNPIAERLAGRCLVLPPRLPGPRTALWHLDLAARVRRRAPDHDVVFDPSGFPHALGGHPCLVSVVHDPSALDRGFYRPGKRAWFRLLLARSLRRSARILCVSEWTRGEVLRRFDVDAERVAVVPNPVDPEAPAPAERLPEGLAAGGFDLVVGRVERRKNPLRVVEGWAAAARSGAAERLVFAGPPGHGYGAVVRRVGELGLAGRIVFLGAVSDAVLSRLYASARALLFASLCEGFGLPAVEAMRAGTPVVAADAAALPEVTGGAALLVDPRDVTGLTAAIVRLDRDARLRAELIRRGHEQVRRFRPDVVAARLADQLAAAVAASSAS